MSQNASTQQYCLRWNNYQNNLTNVFDQLLQSEAFVDVTLACDGNSLKAHKMVLSACSPYFQSLFSENPCSHPIVILKDVKWAELKAIVEFVYRGEINVSQQELAPLLKVAESLKIRGLADVNRGASTSAQFGSHLKNGPEQQSRHVGKSAQHDCAPERNEESQGAQSFSNANILRRVPFPLMSSTPHLPPGGKRRKYSFDERSNSPPTPPDLLDDHSNQLEIDSQNGDFDSSAQSPIAVLEPMTITPGITAHGLVKSSSSSLQSGSTSAVAMGTPPTSSLSNVNELDLKPGIVEMIREEERAKMLESSHGWLGSSSGGPPQPLSDSYQYQIQSLWQKCWNTNQGGLHALRFRERGPLKSWRPETMAEAIFAVLREGLSLSQAARKFDIPYPTFVLYANRVHNMLGPSSDGSGANDLLSDMRPKGRGRPQRILLGTWPEDHIRGVIRAVVFRDGAKEELPYGIPFPNPRDLSQNGVDMTLHQQLAINPYLGLHHAHHLSHNSTSPSHGGPPQATKSPTDSVGPDAREPLTSSLQGQVERCSPSPSSSTSSTRSKGQRSRISPFTSEPVSQPPQVIVSRCRASSPPISSIEPSSLVTIKTEMYNSDDEEAGGEALEPHNLNSPPIPVQSPLEPMSP